MEENIFQKDRLAKLLTTGVFSGIIGAGINIVYMYLHESVTGFTIPEVINLSSVAISTLIPGIFVGLFYFVLRRFTTNSKAYMIFGITLLIIALVSMAGPFANELPDGTIAPKEFASLTAPMHLIGPFIYFIMLVRSVPKS